MSAFTLTVDSDELARIFTNALAFFPARGQVKTALLRVWSDCIEATGTDTYTIGRDECAARDFSSSVQPGDMPIVIELNREGWVDIEKQARKDKGGIARLDFVPGDSLIFTPAENGKAEKGIAQDVTGKETTVLINGETLETRDVWGLCDELLERLKPDPQAVPHVMAFDPSLFVRFNKVRTPKAWEAETIIDFVYQGEAEPMLAKIGPSFVGAIMPINRKVYAQNQPEGQGGLW